MATTRNSGIGHNSCSLPKTRGKSHGYRLRKRGNKWHCEFRRKSLGYMPPMVFEEGTKKEDAIKQIQEALRNHQQAGTPTIENKSLCKYTIGRILTEWRSNHLFQPMKLASPTWIKQDQLIASFQNKETALCELMLSDARRITDGFKLLINRRLQEGKVKPYSITRELSPIRTIFRRMDEILFILEERTIEWTNPIAGIKWPEDNSGRQRYLKFEDDTKVFTAVLKQSPDILFRRKWIALITAAIVTGLRRKVLCSLKWDDIDYTNQVIHIRDSYWEHLKPAPPMVPLTVKLAQELKTYYAILKEDRKQLTSLIFQPEKRHFRNETYQERVARKRMSRSALDWADRGFARIIRHTDLFVPNDKGGKDWFHFHDLRHTAVTRYKHKPYKLGADQYNYLLGKYLKHKYVHINHIEWCDDMRKDIEAGDARLPDFLQAASPLTVVNMKLEGLFAGSTLDAIYKQSQSAYREWTDLQASNDNSNASLSLTK